MKWQYTRNFLIAVVAIEAASFGVRAETRKASIYDIGHTTEAARFSQSTELSTDLSGVTTWSSKIDDASGKTVMTEVARIAAGKVQYQYVVQLQIEEAYELTREADRVTFTTFSLSGEKKEKKSESKVDASSDFIMGPTIEPFLARNLEALASGSKARADFGIFELARFISFNFEKTSSTETEIDLTMKPANFFFSLLTRPLLIRIRKQDKRIIWFKGRTPLREKIDGKWQPIDAEIIYR